MFRLIVEFVVLLVIFSIARSVIGTMIRLFAAAQAEHAPESSNRASDTLLASAGELRKDPVCGTFVPAATSLNRVVRGETVYFCSANCRDKFALHPK